MARALPSVGAGEYAALVASANQPILDTEESWIKNSSGNVVVFFSLDALVVSNENTFSAIVVRDGQITEAALQKLFALLKAGGSLVIQNQGEENESTLSTNLVLNGFINSQTNKDDGKVTVESVKPNYDAEAAAIPVNNAKNIWKLNANDFDDAGYELEDEDQLLDDEAEVKPKAADLDCGTGGPGQKRRACKNCVCGLKEMIEEEEKAPNGNGKLIEPSSSACGNCSKGDAFRCAGCPYLGTPSFDSGMKPPIQIKEDGTKILLDVQNDAL